MLAPRLSRSSLLRAAASIGVRHGSTITMKNGVLAVPNDPIIPFIEGAGGKSRVDFGMARCHGLWRRLLGPPCLPIAPFAPPWPRCISCPHWLRAPVLPPCAAAGDGTGPDIWRSSVRVLDAAVAKAYGGAKKIQWLEVLAGEKAFRATGGV